MTAAAAEVSQARAARLAGAMFLSINATGIFSEIVVRGSLLSGDAEQVALNIIGAERLYRFSIVGDLLTYAGVMVLTWALYVLLRPVNRDLALLALLVRAVEVVVGAVMTVASLIAVRLLTSTEYLEAFAAEEVHALSRLARTVFGLGQDVGFIFVGLGSGAFAVLLLRSRYVPRILAGWGVFANVIFTLYNFAIIVFPGVQGKLMIASFAPIGIYEICIGFWLLLRGARVPAS